MLGENEWKSKEKLEKQYYKISVRLNWASTIAFENEVYDETVRLSPLYK